ncbi:MAG: acyl-CoA thioesterase [Acidobacteriaceae bacterium]|nr:acyl-CoA thioesterase [Acidobacteriaceae bacterium]
MLTNRREIHIEFGDCDPGGIVYFPRYFEYFDACTNALFDRAGLPKREMIARYGIAGIPMVECSARFIVPSQYGDTVAVESCVSAWGRSSFSVQHKLFRGDVLAVEGLERRVWVAHATEGESRFRGEAIPQEVKDRFAGKSGTHA